MCTCPHLHLLSMQRLKTSFRPALLRAQPTALLGSKHATLLRTHMQSGFRSEALHTHRQGSGKGAAGRHLVRDQQRVVAPEQRVRARQVPLVRHHHARLSLATNMQQQS